MKRIRCERHPHVAQRSTRAPFARDLVDFSIPCDDPKAAYRVSVSTVRISVRAKPRAKKSRILRASELSIEVALHAAPVDGAANDELVAVVAEALDLPKRALSLVLGHTSKNKVLSVAGLAEADVVFRLKRAVEPDNA